MGLYLFLEFLLNNQSVLGRKISALSHPVRNTIFLVFLVLLVSQHLTRQKYYLKILFVLSTLGGKDILTPALSNSLFTIHPPLLYITVILAIVGCIRRERKPSVWPLAGLAFSMILGGYWSMQELSWGGW